MELSTLTLECIVAYGILSTWTVSILIVKGLIRRRDRAAERVYQPHVRPWTPQIRGYPIEHAYSAEQHERSRHGRR